MIHILQTDVGPPGGYAVVTEYDAAERGYVAEVVDYETGQRRYRTETRTTQDGAYIAAAAAIAKELTKTVRVIAENHYYSSNGKVYEVSQEAAEERIANWHEYYGYAHGSAKVEHPDWYAVLEDVAADDGRAAEDVAPWVPLLVVTTTPDGTTAHVGSICLWNNGKVDLTG